MNSPKCGTGEISDKRADIGTNISEKYIIFTNTAWGVLVYDEAQCFGYARVFKALCDEIGIGGCYFHAEGNVVKAYLIVLMTGIKSFMERR